MNQLPPDRTVFLWDLHEVVFQKSWHKLIRSIIFFDRKKEVMRGFSKELFQLVLLSVKSRLKRSEKSSISAADILYLAEKNNNNALIDLLFQICFAYRPNTTTVAIIKQLKASGFTHHIGSNIPQPVFESFRELYPDIFALFDYAHVVGVNDWESTIKKPDPLFFISYLQMQKLQPNQVLFIDDKKRNINTAKKLGIKTVHFQRPIKLRKRLVELGFLTSTSESHSSNLV